MVSHTAMTKKYLLPLLLLTLLLACGPQQEQGESQESSPPVPTRVGGPCHTCELMYMGMPAYTVMGPRDTTSGWFNGEQKLLVGGQVWRPDGITPAGDVLIYFWHTDESGLYTPGHGMDERAENHGYLRGWVRTDIQGRWAIHTSRPGPYPNGEEPVHIHILIKEPDLEHEYYIDPLTFDDDPLLTEEEKNALEQRGGNGILRVEWAGKTQLAEHHIYLGKNIPGHPQKH